MFSECFGKIPKFANLLCLSQYYFNPHTQQYMYWDGDKKIYIPAATEQANAEGAPSSIVDPDSPFAAPGKEKKDKPKNKTAQQVFTKVFFFHLFEITEIFI